MNGVKGVSKTAKPTRIDNITDKSKMGLVARTLLTALKVTVSVVVLYQGICMFRPDLDPDLFYFFDAKFRGVYGKEIQDFVTNVLGSSYKIKPLSIKRTIGIYEIAFVILLWVGNGAFFGGLLLSVIMGGAIYVQYFLKENFMIPALLAMSCLLIAFVSRGKKSTRIFNVPRLRISN